MNVNRDRDQVTKAKFTWEYISEYECSSNEIYTYIWLDRI